MSQHDTIVAQATAPGRGGIGILRVSGKAAKEVAQQILGKLPKERVAEYLPFKDNQNCIIDQGIALYFPGPNSFTGEDVLEFQGHGGPVVLDILMQEILKNKSIRIAKPGEFTERAFLNDKLDLAQAEAIADLIDASSIQAARSAINSLQGQFSEQVHQLVEAVIGLRIHVEAAIDFPEEEIDFLSDGNIQSQLNAIFLHIDRVRREAKQGSLLREGMKVVIAGRPNAGKSSLLNALAGKEAAIVTDIEGTTRDILKEHIHIDGMPLHIIDTAGLREADDHVERIGIQRAWQAINEADHILLMVDASSSDLRDAKEIWPSFMENKADNLSDNEIYTLPNHIPVTVIRNKADLSGEEIGIEETATQTVISLSAKNLIGIDYLREHLKKVMGFENHTEGGFIARARHTQALDRAREHLEQARYQLEVMKAGELVAEELRLTQQFLSEITGEFSSDDLLGRIFSSFCIGK